MVMRYYVLRYNLGYKFLTQFLPLKSSVFVVDFSNAFYHGNKAFPKASSQNEIVPLLLIFYMPYSKYRCVEICLYSCRYQNQNVSIVWHSCRSCSTRVALVSFGQYSSRTRVTCVSLVLQLCRSCCTRAVCVWCACW